MDKNKTLTAALSLCFKKIIRGVTDIVPIQRKRQNWSVQSIVSLRKLAYLMQQTASH